jgi:hypothetical protein
MPVKELAEGLMTDGQILALGGLATMALHCFSWVTRKKDGGPLFGYSSSWDAIAPFGVAIGLVMVLLGGFMLISGE